MRQPQCALQAKKIVPKQNVVRSLAKSAFVTFLINLFRIIDNCLDLRNEVTQLIQKTSKILDGLQRVSEHLNMETTVPAASAVAEDVEFEWPISNENELVHFEQKIKTDKNFKIKVVSNVKFFQKTPIFLNEFQYDISDTRNNKFLEGTTSIDSSDHF